MRRARSKRSSPESDSNPVGRPPWFARVPQAEVVAVPGAKHLWVGEPYVRIALNQIVRRVNPAALVPPTMTLPTQWEES